MHYIDPHIHMASRTTDDLQAMALAGCVAVGEPAFWAGFDRSGAGELSRLLPPTHRMGAEAGGQLRHPPLLLAGHERQGGREPGHLPRGHRPAARVPRPARRAGHRRDRLEQVYAQRGEDAGGTDRPGPGPRRADALPHAAPGREVSRHADDPRPAPRRLADRPQPRLHRPLRGADDPSACWTKAIGRASRSIPRPRPRPNGPPTWSSATARSGSW